MSINLINRKIEEVNPSLAKVWLAYNTFVSQRNIRKPHLTFLCQQIREENFRTGEIAFAKQKNNGTTLLMNGQHQLKAVIQTGKPITALIETFEYNTPNDLSELFRRFDCHAIRSTTDMVKVEHDALDLPWPYRVTQVAVSGLSLDLAASRRNKISPKSVIKSSSLQWHRVNRIDLIQKHLKEIAFISELFENKISIENKHLARAAVVAVMFQTMRKAQWDSKIFWAKVRDGAGLKKNEPAAKLRLYLLQTYQVCGKPSAPGYRRAGSKEIMVKCIHAWNAYRRNAATDLSFHAEAPVPKIL